MTKCIHGEKHDRDEFSKMCAWAPVGRQLKEGQCWFKLWRRGADNADVMEATTHLLSGRRR